MVPTLVHCRLAEFAMCLFFHLLFAFQLFSYSNGSGFWFHIASHELRKWEGPAVWQEPQEGQSLMDMPQIGWQLHKMRKQGLTLYPVLLAFQHHTQTKWQPAGEHVVSGNDCAKVCRDAAICWNLFSRFLMCNFDLIDKACDGLLWPGIADGLEWLMAWNGWWHLLTFYRGVLPVTCVQTAVQTAHFSNQSTGNQKNNG